MIGYKKLCLDETDTGDYTDEKGKKYHYKRYSRRKGMNIVQGWADLKFEYFLSFIGMGFMLLVGSLGMVGGVISETAGCYVSSFYAGISVLCAFVAATIRPKKSLAYLLPVSSKDYFRRNVISYLTSVTAMMLTLGFLMVIMNRIFGEGAWELSGLWAFSGEGSIIADLFVFDMCLIQIISLIPLLFMEGKERVKKYMRIMITAFFSIILLFAGIFYTPSGSSALLRLLIFYGTLLILWWIKAWSKVLWEILGIVTVVLAVFDEVWIDWLFEEDWSIYTMIAGGSGWRNVFVYLLFICTFVSVPFFLRLAYREVQPYYKMKRAYLAEKKGLN